MFCPFSSWLWNFDGTIFPDSPIHFFCSYFILCCLLYRHPHLGTPPHHYLPGTPSGRGGNLSSYRVPLLLMAVSVQSQVSVSSLPSSTSVKPLHDIVYHLAPNLRDSPQFSKSHHFQHGNTETLHHFCLMSFDKVAPLFGAVKGGLMVKSCHLLISMLWFLFFFAP